VVFKGVAGGRVGLDLDVLVLQLGADGLSVVTSSTGPVTSW